MKEAVNNVDICSRDNEKTKSGSRTVVETCSVDLRCTKEWFHHDSDFIPPTIQFLQNLSGVFKNRIYNLFILSYILY